MVDRIDTHPTPPGSGDVDERSGKDRRRIHTMLNPDIERRKGDRRRRRLRKSA